MTILIDSPKGKGFAACEAGKLETSNPYPAFDGGCSWDEWMEGWHEAFNMKRFGINEMKATHGIKE